MVPSQLIELGRQALTDVSIGVANGEPLVRCQLLAAEFYEALKRALRAPELSPVERWAVWRRPINAFMPQMQVPVNVIVCAGSTPAAIAAHAASTTVPIVFYGGIDPISTGLVASLSRPGRNLTGVTTLNVEIGAKRLEVLHELVPTATIIAALFNPTPFRLQLQVRGCRE